MKTHQIGLLVFFMLCCFCLPTNIVASGLVDSPWSDYGGGNKNSHRSNLVGPLKPVETRWIYDIPYSTHWLTAQTSLGGDGSIYFTSVSHSGPLTGSLTALNANGSLVWDDYRTGRFFGNWPAVTASGQVVVPWMSSSTTSDWVRSYDATTGAVNWEARTVFEPGVRGVAVDDNEYIYTPDNGNWFMSHSADGTERWRTGGGGATVNPAITDDGKIITGVGSSINAFEPDGTISWTTDVIFTNRFRYLAISDTGDIYATGTGREDLAKFGPNGNVKWIREGLHGAISIGPDGTIYTFDYDLLHAINPNDGSDYWTKNIGPTSNEMRQEGVTVDAAGNLFLANDAGVVIALSPDGETLWEYDLAPDMESLVYPGAPVIGETGVLYVPGGATGKLFALQPIPEPTTYTLAALGLCLLTIRRRRKQTR